MDDVEPIMIASAVVVPGQESSPERLKRRQISETSEVSKRLRLDHGNASVDEDIQTRRVEIAAGTRDDTATDERISRRRTGLEEEKKRGKRLFGALLGTIGKFQKDSTSQRARSNAIKRKEVEAKLQEKLKAQTEELDERRKKEDDDYKLRKRVETRDFEERAMEIRHSSILAQANMLATSTTPKLFYLPWKLLPSEEDTIKVQIELAEATVSNAETTFRMLREEDEEELLAVGAGATNSKIEPTEIDQQDTSIHSPPHDVAEVIDTGDGIGDRPAPSDEHVDNADNNPELRDDNGASGNTRRNSDIGDATDIIEEGGEDTVIY